MFFSLILLHFEKRLKCNDICPHRLNTSEMLSARVGDAGAREPQVGAGGGVRGRGGHGARAHAGVLRARGGRAAARRPRHVARRRRARARRPRPGAAAAHAARRYLHTHYHITNYSLLNISFNCLYLYYTEKPQGYYVTRAGGLFPAPLPQDSAICDKVCKYFWFLGVFLAKVRVII